MTKIKLVPGEKLIIEYDADQYTPKIEGYWSDEDMVKFAIHCATSLLPPSNSPNYDMDIFLVIDDKLRKWKGHGK